MQQAWDIETFKSVYPTQLFEKVTHLGRRMDGRAFHEFRAISGSVGSITTADGSCLVKLGNTVVVCGIKAEVGPPAVEFPEYGFVSKLRLVPYANSHLSSSKCRSVTFILCFQQTRSADR